MAKEKKRKEYLRNIKRICVIHSSTLIVPLHTTIKEWKIVTGERNGQGRLMWRPKLVTRQTAEQFIEDNGLVETYRSKKGSIYEDTSRPLKDLKPTEKELKTLEEANW